jgi:hypothetical protein
VLPAGYVVVPKFGVSMMNRREFGKTVAAFGATLALPSVALSKPRINPEYFGQHLAEFDNNAAIISTLQRSFGTLWYGNSRPEFIMAPYRVAGRVWDAIMPRQRVGVECSRSRYNRGFVFCGAIFFGNDALIDEVVLMNSRYNSTFNPDVWKKYNGWYKASRLILEDPYGDECFERMMRS